MQKADLFGKNIALLLDFDGTLVDLVDDPAQVRVPPELRMAINNILSKTRTSFAIVTGRQVEVLDQFIGLPNLPVSGNHGTEIRLPGSKVITRHVLPMPEPFRNTLQLFCREFGCVLEDKCETAVVRTSNDAAFHAVRNELQKLIAERFQNYALWPIGLSLEIHYRGVSKVTGIQDMLRTGAFKGYTPVYIGDDVETYPALEMLAPHVHMMSVGRGGQNQFHSPQEVRDFLTELGDARIANDNSLAALFSELGFLYRGI